MPLHNPNGGYRDLPYSLKLAMVEHNCTGCKFLKKHRIENDCESEYGCSYPEYLALLNTHIREPFLTVSEIASNTCEYWKSYTKWELETVDAREGYWNDPATVRKSLRFIMDMPTLETSTDIIHFAPGTMIEYDPDRMKMRPVEIIPQMQFSDNRE